MKTHTYTWMLLTLACTVLAAGCEDKTGGGGASAKTEDKARPPGATGGAPNVKTAAAAPLAFKNLDKLGAKIEVPGDAEVTDTSADAPAVSIFTPAGDLSVDVTVTTDIYASTIDAAREEIKKDPNPFKKFTVENKTDDGWHLEFELESMMDKTPLFGVQVRKKIGGRSIQCSRNVKSEAERAKVSKACASLTKI